MNAKETETVNEKIYQIIMITEADYGCEECPPEGPAALVLLRSDDGEQRRMEVPEAVLSAAAIDEGSRVTVGPDGKLRIAGFGRKIPIR